MQETVTNTNERKSLFSSILDVIEAREKQAQVERQLQEEKYLRRTQRIVDFHGKYYTALTYWFLLRFPDKTLFSVNLTLISITVLLY